MQRLINSATLLALTFAPALLAQENAPAVKKGLMSGGSGTIFMMVAMFAVIYFLMIRPEQKKAKDRQNLIKAIKKGDRVLLTSGLYGVVGTVKDTTIMVKAADNVIMEFAKAAVASVLNDDGSEKKIADAKAESNADDTKKESK